ncbi:adenine nucleotide alpha hydrolase family protein [Siminovitchia acidinfaciens]|uniref:hypothetical protein n=1 Tax=Siminovitchia acidinfaciens TaxID=2321395 RepID=UPI0013E0DF5A|nr:hypothetical protein [Siminovitchia acidinfaciens]
MRILVILRQVYEQKSIHWDYENNDFKNRKATINQADLNALQWASDYSKEHNASIDVYILADGECNETLKEKLARFPLNTCTHIPKSGNEQADAHYLASSIEQGMYDLVVCGDETEDEHNSCLLPLLGYSLGMDVLTSVHQIEAKGAQHLLAHRKEERGATQIFDIQFPVALSFTTQISKLRYSRHFQYEIEITKRERVDQIPRSHRRLGSPEPNIIFGKVPEEENPLERLMNVMGFSNNSDTGLSQQTNALSEEHLHFTAERLMKWLKE